MGKQSYGDYDDAEYPSFFNETRPVAKKQHRCCECKLMIEPGEKYYKATGCWSGDVSSYKTCPRCLEMIEMIKQHFDPFNYSFGALHESIYYAAYDLDFKFIKTQTPGYLFKLGRLYIRHQLNSRRKSRELFKEHRERQRTQGTDQRATG